MCVHTNGQTDGHGSVDSTSDTELEYILCGVCLASFCLLHIFGQSKDALFVKFQWVYKRTLVRYSAKIKRNRITMQFINLYKNKLILIRIFFLYANQYRTSPRNYYTSYTQSKV